MDHLTKLVMDSFAVSKATARIGVATFLLALVVLVASGVRLLG